ncbi:RNI-like protein, partial [Nadsonia fulvescens var. elongata DSM 6958]
MSNQDHDANIISNAFLQGLKHDRNHNTAAIKVNQYSPIHSLPPELLGIIFSYLSKKNDLLNTSLVSYSWFKPAIEYLWLRPHLSHENKQNALSSICLVLKAEQQGQTTTNYSAIIKRLNFLSHADILDDISLSAFSSCIYLERISLTNCKNITDSSLVEVLKNNPNVISLDITNVGSLSDKIPFMLSEHCLKLQTLYASNCTQFTDAGIQSLAMNCRYLKRVKLTNCANISDDSISTLLKNCPHLIELDLFGCEKITNETVSQVFVKLNQLREINLGLNTFITDQAFMNVTPITLLLDRLRVVDFTGCAHLTDISIGKLISAAPRIRNIVLTKCLNITDQSLMEISRLGRFLQYIHLGHCNNITDFGINQLSRSCVKIQYIDVACCTQITNTSVYDLSLLPKLRRIGLVKCVNITDSAVLALAHTTANDHMLERVHLSYCTNISLHAVMRLLNSCLRLNHLSLTGVNAFMRSDLRQYCREPPSDFNQHQQALFCVYSGDGVGRLREHLNRLAE